MKFGRKSRIAGPEDPFHTNGMTSTVTSTPPQEPDAARWSAVLGRDRTADGTFVYGVRSTGIYCRPSCPSRRPSRSHVVFFGTPGEAEWAGFRSCRRCRPDHPAAADPWADKIQRACVYLANSAGHRSLATLARRVGGGSPYHLQRNFKRLVGVTPREFADACRFRTVKQRLRRRSEEPRLNSSHIQKSRMPSSA